MKLALIIFSFFCILNTYSQTEENLQETYVHKVEEFILENKLDSAATYLKGITENNYSKILESIIKKEAVSY